MPDPTPNNDSGLQPTLLLSILFWAGDKMQEIALWLLGVLTLVLGYLWKNQDSRLERMDERYERTMVAFSDLSTRFAGMDERGKANHEMLIYIRERMDETPIRTSPRPY